MGWGLPLIPIPNIEMLFFPIHWKLVIHLCMTIFLCWHHAALERCNGVSVCLPEVLALELTSVLNIPTFSKIYMFTVMYCYENTKMLSFHILLMFHQKTEIMCRGCCLRKESVHADDASLFETLHPLVLVQCQGEWEWSVTSCNCRTSSSVSCTTVNVKLCFIQVNSPLWLSTRPQS